MIWRFLRILIGNHIWYLLIIAIFIPICSELFSFPWGHNIECISYKHIDMIILDVAGGMLRSFIFKFCDNSFEFGLEKSTQAIIFGPADCEDPTIDGDRCADDRYNEVMEKIHEELTLSVSCLALGSLQCFCL